ncbi:hypothetical protein PATY110618_09965 [Paenibacillus typhae]|uniref:Uncharacterized protein n=1 Tax=Paenibacillus typhae TaxID=1174501 RepID=A0A1G8MJ81_9BACL|nr:hypothetical protein SAMN05216192_107119 [Paenibacillus typhae]
MMVGLMVNQVLLQIEAFKAENTAVDIDIVEIEEL